MCVEEANTEEVRTGRQSSQYAFAAIKAKFGTKRDALKSDDRSKPLVEHRHWLMFLMHVVQGWEATVVGKVLCKDHSTVLNGANRIKQLLRRSEEARAIERELLELMDEAERRQRPMVLVPAPRRKPEPVSPAAPVPEPEPTPAPEPEAPLERTEDALLAFMARHRPRVNWGAKFPASAEERPKGSPSEERKLIAAEFERLGARRCRETYQAVVRNLRLSRSWRSVQSVIVNDRVLEHVS